MTNEKLNLQPLQKLLTSEVDLSDLIRYMDAFYYYFTEFSMKTSCFEDVSIEKEVILCQHWFVRLKQVFEEMNS